MDDLEITHLCAQAMGIKIHFSTKTTAFYIYHPMEEILPLFKAYNPLHDDEQAMALVKKFDLRIYERSKDHWRVAKPAPQLGVEFASDEQDLNRAICECVAKMQKESSRG